MDYDIIGRINDCKNLFELSDNLKKLIAAMQSLNNKNNALKDLYSVMRVNRLYQNTDKAYLVLKDEESVRSYLYYNWNLKKTYKDNVECIQKIIADIDKNMLSPQKSRISAEMIEALMELVESKFHFCEKVLNPNRLEILLLDHSHVNFNSFYCANLLSDDRLADRVMMTYLRDKIDYPQEFVFLHELGHALHTRITKKLMTPPESFKLIKEIMFAGSLSSSKEESAEIFADCFAITALYESDFKQYNPHTFIDEKDARLLVFYMKGLIQGVF